MHNILTILDITQMFSVDQISRSKLLYEKKELITHLIKLRILFKYFIFTWMLISHKIKKYMCMHSI